MNKTVLLLAFCILVSSGFFAYDNPTTFISSNTYLVSDNEAMPEYLEIALNEKPFHVIKVTSATEHVGLIALNKSEQEIVSGGVTLKQLFTAFKFYESYSEFKESLKNTPSAEWFISKGRIAQQLADGLNDERNDLIIVDSQLDDSAMHSLITQLKTKLTVLSTDTLLFSDSLKEANDFEVSFLHEPFVGGGKQLKDQLVDIFEQVQSLNEGFSEYNTDIDNLKILIGARDDLSIESKRSLQNVLDPPNDFSKVGEWAYYSSDFKNSVEGVYENSLSTANDEVTAFEERLEKAAAFEVLYIENQAIKNEFEENFSINQAVEFILADPNISKWNAQSLISGMQSDWDTAERFFSRNDFDKAENYAKRAKNKAIEIHKQGMREEGTSEGPSINTDLLFGGGLAIIILLIVLVLIRNREKFSSFLGKEVEEGEESVDVYEWK